MTLRTHLCRLARETRGAALVEFTLLAPLLISLMCGLSEFGMLLRQYHIMEKGVRDAARYLTAVPAHPPCTGVTDPPGARSWSDYVGDAPNIAIYGARARGTPLLGTWTDPSTVTVSSATCVANPRPLGNPLPKIKVTARAPYVDLGMLRFLGFGPITLTVSHEELKVW